MPAARAALGPQLLFQVLVLAPRALVLTLQAVVLAMHAAVVAVHVFVARQFVTQSRVRLFFVVSHPAAPDPRINETSILCRP